MNPEVVRQKQAIGKQKAQEAREQEVDDQEARIGARLQEMGLKQKEMREGGSCQFHALADQLGLQGKDSHIEVPNPNPNPTPNSNPTP